MAKNRLDFEAKLSRHSHDITAGYTASLTPGCIVPQYFHILSPGDSIYYNTKLFVRFKDVVTAFLGEVDIHLDYYFVPLQMLYLPFGQVFAQTNDVVSSSFSLGSTDKFPLLANFPYFDGEGTSHDGLNPDPSAFRAGHFECLGKENVRLLDALGVNPLTFVAYSGRPSVEGQLDSFRGYNPLLSPWVFAAYQAIYQNFYRNDEFERFDIESYNFDKYYTESSFEKSQMTALRYVQRPSDYFTSVRVSPIASGVNRLGQTETSAGHADLGSLLNKTRQFLNGGVFDISGYNTAPATSFNATSISSENPVLEVNTANIRALFAVDKFLRVYGRAGKTYDDQILAHFGVKVPHDVKHQATRLATYHTAIGSDPVYATSTAGVAAGSVLGQVGGQASGEIKVVGGNGRGNYAAKFTAPVHGVFMAVAYAVTKPRYSCTFNKLHLLNDRLSFPIPEYDKLGAQPIYAFEAYPHTLGLQTSNYGVNRIGWQNRYQEFKKKYNRVSLNYLHSDLEDYMGAENNSFSAWVLSRMPYDSVGQYDVNQSLVSANDLFERPDALNSVMAVPYDGTWHNEYYAHPHEILDTDPLITEFQCEAKLVSWMSETGEPDMGM